MTAGLSAPPAPAAPEAPTERRRLPRWASAMIVVGIAMLILAVTALVTGRHEITASGTIRAAVGLMIPILLAGLGGLWSERAGVINIGLEGMMILGTWGAAYAGVLAGPWAAIAGGLVLGALGGLLHAVATVTFGVNHIISGVAITLLGAGVARYLATLVFKPETGNPRQSPDVPGFDTFSVQPLAGWLDSLEKAGIPLLSDVVGLLRGPLIDLTPLVVLAFLLIPLTYWVLWRTRFGLRLRSCGENPVAAESLGVAVYTHKYAAVIVSGGLAGLGGAALVLAPGQHGYLEGQTGGRGYIGLAAMIFGNWRPGGTLAGSALFGFVDALQLSSGGDAVHALLFAGSLVAVAVAVWLVGRRRWVPTLVAVGSGLAVYVIYLTTASIPRELATYSPQLVTLLVLAVASQRLRPPAADGLEYRRGDD